MKAVITVIGHDTVGVVARVSAVCAELNINIEDITQSILQGYVLHDYAGGYLCLRKRTGRNPRPF